MILCSRLNKTLRLLFWNIRGVKNKFTCNEVLNLLSGIDILIISETHFGSRHKSPAGFYLVVRSDPIESSKPRGGVAIYQRVASEIKTRKIELNIPDCCVISIVNTKIVIIALYIPPQGSPFYNETYFDNLKTVYESLSRTYEIIIVGDLNARISNRFPHRGTSYQTNPDKAINNHGVQLNKILDCCENMKVVNGAITEKVVSDSRFTYFSGNRASQNDWCLTNNLDMISDFKILPKLIYSDHCPCLQLTTYRTWPALGMIYECSKGFNNDLHYDVNRKLPQTIKADNLNLVAFGLALEEKAEQILDKYTDTESTQSNIDTLCNELTETIRKIGIDCHIKNHNHLPAPTQQNCTSENFAAIAFAHQSEYQRLVNTDTDRATYHRSQWLFYEETALQKETEEDKLEKKWRDMYYKDPASLWKSIGWKEPTKADEIIPSHVTYNFFTDVFQSKKTAGNPTLEEHSIEEFLNEEEEDVDRDNGLGGIDCDDITMQELENGI